MRRTGFLKRGKRLSPVSKKMRDDRQMLKGVVAQVLARTSLAPVGHCEFTDSPAGHWGPMECHHVQKRSQGGAHDASNLVRLCRAHHAQTDAPFANGRLCVVALGNERFDFTVVMVRDKWAARA